MGRPKGSRNRPHADIPASALFTLTEEDLAAIRQRGNAHKRAADNFCKTQTAKEINNPEIGEPRTVHQVVEFDMNGAFNKAALAKAQAAGFAGIADLHKDGGAWLFRGLTETEVRRLERKRDAERRRNRRVGVEDEAAAEL